MLSTARMCFQESVLSFHLWVLGTELGSSGLSANAFKKNISSVLSCFLISILVCCNPGPPMDIPLGFRESTTAN